MKLIYCPSNQSSVMRKQTNKQIVEYLSLTSPFLLFSSSLPISLSTHFPKHLRGTRTGGCGLCCSPLLTVFPCLSVGSLSQETTLHKLLQWESFPQATVLANLSSVSPFHMVQFLRISLAWVLHSSTRPSSKPALA